MDLLLRPSYFVLNGVFEVTSVSLNDTNMQIRHLLAHTMIKPKKSKRSNIVSSAHIRGIVVYFARHFAHFNNVIARQNREFGGLTYISAPLT